MMKMISIPQRERAISLVGLCLFAGSALLLGRDGLEGGGSIRRFLSDEMASKTTSPTKLPLQVFPLLKELRSGWSSSADLVPPLVERDATGVRALVVNVGLDNGAEFTRAIENGFETVGFEPNPYAFEQLAEQCSARTNCKVIDDIDAITLPLQRETGMSYLIHAGAGAEKNNLEINSRGPGSSFVSHEKDHYDDAPKITVPVVRLDEVIQEDIFLLMIDTQGFDHFVLEGAQKIFENHVVRQTIFEVEPKEMKAMGVDIIDTLTILQKHGLICFSGTNDRKDCDYLGDSAEGFKKQFFDEMEDVGIEWWAKCGEDVVCLNVAKVYPGDIPPLKEY